MHHDGISIYLCFIQVVAKDDNNNNGPKSNVTAILYNQTTGETITKVTGSDGIYTFEDIPVGSTCFISVGGVSGYYSFNNIEYTVPSSIDIISDTIMTDASCVMYAVRPEIFQFNVLTEQTDHGANTPVRLYWFDPNDVPPQDISIYNSEIAQYDAQTNDYTHVQTPNEDEAHIKIYDGPFNQFILGCGPWWISKSCFKIRKRVLKILFFNYFS